LVAGVPIVQKVQAVQIVFGSRMKLLPAILILFRRLERLERLERFERDERSEEKEC
jgi:hypothetical protein